MRSARIALHSLLLLGLTASLAYADYNASPNTSGKRKLAYAPYQKASFSHISPSTTSKTSDQENLSLSGLSVEDIVQRANRSVDQDQNMIAAGWPGGQQPSSQATSTTAQPKPVPQPSSAQVHPSSAPASQGSAPAISGFIYGQIELDESLKSQVKPGSILFVIVRRYAPEGQKGMMIAATKIEGITTSAFPLKYVVKQSDAMMGAPLVGKVSVSVRIDQDGDAISKQPGDIIGSAAEAVMVGVNPVAIKLNQTL